MAEIKYVGKAKQTQYDELMRVINRSFNLAKPTQQFLGLLPKLYLPENNPCENNYIVSVGEEIRAALGVFYNDIVVGDNVIKTAGITNAAIPPEYKDFGYRDELMTHAKKDMLKDKVDIAYIGGHMQKNPCYGFNNGGHCYKCEFSREYLYSQLGADFKTELKAVALTPDKRNWLDDISNAYNNILVHATRERKTLYNTLVSWHSLVYVLTLNKEFKGYFIFNETKEQINGFILNDKALIKDMLAAAFSVTKADRINIMHPAFMDEYTDSLIEISDNYSLAHNSLFCVYNFEKVISVFLDAKAKYRKMLDESVVLLIHGIAGDEKIKITIKNNIPTVKKSRSEPDIELTHDEAIAFISQYYSPKRHVFSPALVSWFPLDFYVFNTDLV